MSRHLESRLSFFLAGIHTVSAIETILDKDRFTLEELLEEDEVLQVRRLPASLRVLRLIFFFLAR